MGVALVTGAGRGQGRAQAVALAGLGLDVAACDLGHDLPTIPYPLASPEDLEETGRLVRELGRRCLVGLADAADLAAMRALAARAEAELGPVEVVVANAGVISFGRSWELEEAEWDEVIRADLRGAWVTCRATLPAMVSRRRGSVVLVGSAASLRGYPGIAHYAAAKHGLLGLMRTLALELAPFGLRVNCVLPGGVRTPMGTSAAMRGWLDAHPDAARALTAPLPVDLVEPDEVAAAVAWLASESARHVTGVALPVDAGVQLR